MVTQVSTAEAETQPDSKDAGTEREGGTIGHGVDPAKQRQTAGGGGVIDLDKLMHTIDMTRKVAMLQQRLNQASLLAQRQSNPTVPDQPPRPSRPTPPVEGIEAAASPSASNLRKRKSMASLSIVAPRELESYSSSSQPNSAAHLLSPSRPSTFRQSPGPGSAPRSPSYTTLRSPSSSAAAGIQVLNNIASRRRESASGLESPRNLSGGGPQQTMGTGPRVAFAYPRSPGGPSGMTPVQTVRSPNRGRYISSSGYPRFETSGFAEFGIGTREKSAAEPSSDAMDLDSDPAAQSPRKRLKSLGRPDHQPASQTRKPSATLMPAFGSNTIYGISQHPGQSAAAEISQPSSTGQSSKKIRSASHSVESRPFVARNILTGYQHVETPKSATGSFETPFSPASTTTPSARMNMPLGTDASDVDAANGLMSMLGSAPATFNPSRNAGPARIKSPPSFEGSGAPVAGQLRAPKPRAASFAAILTSNRGLAGPAQRLASPTRVRRLQHDKQRGFASPSSAKRQGTKSSAAFASDENGSACATSSSDEEKFKASASASDEDQQAAEAILFLAASPSPAIAHSSPKKALAGGTSSTDGKIGRVLFHDTMDEADSARATHSLKGYSALPISVLSQKRPAVGDSPLQQPPINNTSPSRDRFSRALPAPLPLMPRNSLEADTFRQEKGNHIPELPLTASTTSAMDDAEHSIQLPEPTQLLSPPHSDDSKP